MINLSQFFLFLLKIFYRGNNKNSNDKEPFLMKNTIKEFDQKKKKKNLVEKKNFYVNFLS